MKNSTLISVLIAAGLAQSPALAQFCNFDTPVSYNIPSPFGSSSPSYIASGDIDNDGDIDLITDSNGPGNDPTQILWNDGTGIFSLGPVLTSGWGFGQVALGDMDGDGDLDVLRANYWSNGVMFYRNNGDGSFSSPTFYAGGGGCVAVLFTDFDNDGDLDFVTVNKFGNQIRPYRNINGLGFTSVGLFDCGSDPLGMTSADVDHDGDQDIVVTNEDSATMTVLYNDGMGLFPTRQSFPVGQRPTDVVLADFNGDSHLDAVVTDWNSLIGIGNTVSVLLGDGSGSFGTRQTYTTGVGPRSVRTADMNGDGTLDLVVACEISDTLSVLSGNGDGTFDENQTFDAGFSPNFLALDDLDADGDIDIAFVSNGSNRLVTVGNDCSTPIDPPSMVVNWQAEFDNFFNIDKGTHIVTTSTGESIVAGTTSFNFNEEDFLILKFDSQGNKLWEVTYNGSGDHFDQPQFVGLDSNNNIFVAGKSWGTNSSIQWAVLKIDQSGNILWTRRYDGGNPSAQQNPLGFAIGPSGEFAMCGWTQDPILLAAQFAVVKYDSSGNQVWDIAIGGQSFESAQAEALAFDSHGNVFATGTAPIIGASGDEMLTAKIDTSGTILWTDRQDLSPDTFFHTTVGRAITTNAAGTIFVAADVNINGFSDSDATLVVYTPDGSIQSIISDTRPGSVLPSNLLWTDTDSLLMTGFSGSGQVFATSFDAAGFVQWTSNIEAEYRSVNRGGHVALGTDGMLYFLDSAIGDVAVEQWSTGGEFISRTQFDLGSAQDIPMAITSSPAGHVSVAGEYQPLIVSRQDVFVLDLVGANSCSPDLTGDGQLDFFDISSFLVSFRTNDPSVDFTGDGAFDFFDISMFLQLFSQGCP